MFYVNFCSHFTYKRSIYSYVRSLFEFGVAIPKLVTLRVWRPTLVSCDLVQNSKVGDVFIRVKAHVDLFKKLLDERVIMSVRLPGLLNQVSLLVDLGSSLLRFSLVVFPLDARFESYVRLILVNNLVVLLFFNIRELEIF